MVYKVTLSCRISQKHLAFFGNRHDANCQLLKKSSFPMTSKIKKSNCLTTACRLIFFLFMEIINQPIKTGII